MELKIKNFKKLNNRFQLYKIMFTLFFETIDFKSKKTKVKII